jgi:hypothetical protein
MRTPQIAIVTWARPNIPRGVFQACETRGLSLFVVESSGRYGERQFRAGEILVCGEGARAGEAVVLIPRGRGRVRLGAVKGTSLIGDGGEVCSQARWAVAGHLKAIIRPLAVGEQPPEDLIVQLPTPRGWVVEPWRQAVQRRPLNRGSARPAEGQLSLFTPSVRRAA